MRSKLLRFFIALFLLIVISTLFFLMKSSVPSDESLLKSFSFQNSHTRLGYLTYDGRKVRYVKIESQDDEVPRPVLIMIHGAPGGMSAFEKYTQDSLLRSHYDMLIYERPGYGLGDPRPEGSIIKQADFLIELLDNQMGEAQDVAFLSHSYGGAIAAVASTQIGQNCLGHVMVAPVLDESSEPVFWFSALPSKWLIKDLVAQEWYTSSVEKMNHGRALSEAHEWWKQVKCLTVHFHGLDDWIAPAENVTFVKSNFPPNVLISQVFEERSHFILWTDDTFDLIKERLLTF